MDGMTADLWALSDEIARRGAPARGTVRLATVTRVEEGTVYVSIPGGVPETPLASMQAEAAPGDEVTVEWRSSKLYGTGNMTDKAIGAARAAAAAAAAARLVARKSEIDNEELERRIAARIRELGLTGELGVSLVGSLSVPTAGGPSVSYAGAVDASAQGPRGAELSGSLGVRTSGGPTVGFSASCSFGDAMHAVPSSELAPVPPQVQASGYSWSASSAAVVETVELGGDLGVSGVESVTAAVSGEVAFSASFDGGATWLAWDGSGWAPGTMGADQMSAAAGWPSAPLRVRMEMAGGSSVNGLTVWFERSM